MVSSEFRQDIAVFGVIFVFLCLISALFSCIVSRLARRKQSKIQALPFQECEERRYSEMTAQSTNILY